MAALDPISFISFLALDCVIKKQWINYIAWIY